MRESAVSAAVSNKRAALSASVFVRLISTPQRLTKPFTTQRGRFIIATLQELTQQECPISTCSSAVFHASRIQWQRQIPEDLPTLEALFSLNLPELSRKNDLQLFCLKMFPDSYLMTASGRFRPSSVRFRNGGIVLNGWCLTAQPLILHSQGTGCTLWDIAVPNAPEKYSLSNAAITKLLSNSSAVRNARESTPPRELP